MVFPITQGDHNKPQHENIIMSALFHRATIITNEISKNSTKRQLNRLVTATGLLKQECLKLVFEVYVAQNTTRKCKIRAHYITACCVQNSCYRHILIITIIITLQPLYRTTCIGHHLTVKNWRILLEQSFTVSMSLLTATYYQIIYSLQSHFH